MSRWDSFVVLNIVTVDVLKVGEGFKHRPLCIKKAINFRKAWPSNCNMKGRKSFFYVGWGAGIGTAQTWNVCGGRGYANAERISIRMSKRTEHHRGERVPFLLHPHTNAFACIKAEIDFRHIADEEWVATTMALPQALVYGHCKEN